MTPFNEYLEEAKRIRAEYKILINQNPAQKDQLLSEMNGLISKKLDECERKELERCKHL